MKIIEDDAARAFRDSLNTVADAKRVKDLREGPLSPGGRVAMTLFERAPSAPDRAHPRLRVEMPPAADPSPTRSGWTEPASPSSVKAALDAVRAARLTESRFLRAEDLDPSAAPRGSEHYHQNSVRVQRTARFFEAVRKSAAVWMSGPLAAEREALLLGLRGIEAEAYAGEVAFDDGDTGTYHSFGHDKPFVHYLERILEGLPEDGTQAMALLSAEQQESVRRQRQQARNHLDFLMRRKYAYHGIDESDIERTLGGLLIDRETRQIVSESAETQNTLTPRYELLRINPTLQHPHAGAYVHRGDGEIRLHDGEAVNVKEEDLRPIPVKNEQLTFLRGPDDYRLREGIRFDWDGNGFVRQGSVGWVDWAGHCDIKAIMESLGIVLGGPPSERPSLDEYRSDTGATTSYDRDLLLEMVASTLELGSSYTRADASGTIIRGLHRFGGSRNDSRPDRLQFTGRGPGKSFRWPLSNRQEVLVVTGIELGEQKLDVEQVFQRYLPDMDKLDFSPNPRYIKTVEGDYNVIDVSGAKLRLRVQMESYDELSGYPREQTRDLVIDLGPNPAEKRQLLGTHTKDGARRELYEVWLDREKQQIEAKVLRYERGPNGRYSPRALEDQTVRIPLAAGLNVTLSREMKEDDPAMLRNLLDIAVRQAQNICADTDMAAEVWNGVVTRIKSERIRTSANGRVEHWKVDLKARFGQATFEYLLKLTAEGRSEAWCALPGRRSPDFLWQDFPDVGSKGQEGGDWVINTNMLDRGIVQKAWSPATAGNFYVYDDHIKNVYEILWTALSGHRWSILHDNKRYAFANQAAWKAAIAKIDAARAKLKFRADR